MAQIVKVHTVQVTKIILYLILIMLMLSMKVASRGELVPALFMFGDSLADVGNNNHLPLSLTRADFPHNGLDFPTHKPTGRFSNGKNAADFLADKLGLPSAPPYLYLAHIKNSNFSTGVNFASGGAGILDGTDQLYRQSLTMNKQVQCYATVQETLVQQLGQAKANELLSKSIIAIVIGSNDILGYFGSSSSSQMQQTTPQEFVTSMVQGIEEQLKNIYDLGARKFVLIGIASVGCSPAQRRKNKTEDCNEIANYWAFKYNQGLLSVLQEFKSVLQGFRYSYFNTYDVLLNLIQQPATYGFKEVKEACCGLGILKARVACLPIATYCANRSDHVFWDFYHPTEAAYRIFIDIAFDGPEQYVFPVNIRELASS
ncbi:hypothetical protein RND81_04G051400 [Saponaria officinalis]|uniref:GDSL esterase/lipase At5g55050-like n=1 Tax=Saponaria officinalis TaxID=3572 RepID=A0AAW1LHA0_SAPOF